MATVPNVLGWFATFIAAAIGTASILTAAWAVLLIVDPAEQTHFEYAVPALVLAGVGAAIAVVLLKRGR